MAEFVVAAVFLAAGAVSAAVSPLAFRAAVLLALALASAGLGLLVRLERSHGSAVAVLGWVLGVPAVVAVAATGLLLIAAACYLLHRWGPQLPQLAALLTGCVLVGTVVANAVVPVVRESGFTDAMIVVDALVGYGTALFVCFAGYALAWGRRRTRPGHGTTHLLVLGAGLVQDRPGRLLTRRLNKALELDAALAAAGEAPPRLVVSGGRGEDEPCSEADAMARYLARHGVAKDRVLREERSRNTEENLRYSAELMARTDGPDYRCTAVTSSFHVYRTMLLARQNAVPVRVVGARTSPAYWLAATLRELVAVLWADRAVFLLLSIALAMPVTTTLLSR